MTESFAPKVVLEKELTTLTITIDPTLANIEVHKLPREKIESIKRILDSVRFSDSYYLKVSAEHNSQTLKYAIEENLSARSLNNIVRDLTGTYPDLDDAL
jgi:hypothetical protein